jgi:hypothetical protein
MPQPGRATSERISVLRVPGYRPALGETELEKRNASGYDRALGLLLDLRTLAQEDDAVRTFSDRIRCFIARLRALDQQ